MERLVTGVLHATENIQQLNCARRLGHDVPSVDSGCVIRADVGDESGSFVGTRGVITKVYRVFLMVCATGAWCEVIFCNSDQAYFVVLSLMIQRTVTIGKSKLLSNASDISYKLTSETK